ncbi:hypothetical protein GJ496_011548 [Pomphorhynchus laevis]|nr:hypothetical protein GJ496_011548 [Pomphorhynchus laevis]
MTKNGLLSRASRLLENQQRRGVLDLNEDIQGKSVLERLIDLHPERKTAESELSTKSADENTVEHHLTRFLEISSSNAVKAAKLTKCSVGPSGTDSREWNKFLTEFGIYSTRLAASLSDLIKISTKI